MSETVLSTSVSISVRRDVVADKVFMVYTIAKPSAIIAANVVPYHSDEHDAETIVEWLHGWLPARTFDAVKRLIASIKD